MLYMAWDIESNVYRLELQSHKLFKSFFLFFWINCTNQHLPFLLVGNLEEALLSNGQKSHCFYLDFVYPVQEPLYQSLLPVV